ncbi:MAG TPA: tetratricopeptide repeat protein, partial [Candidatus Latescibacteria bacterium]|nr:tetratricopeptide repeat protein [Candidatus Latescibacterota bacterium]
KFCTRLLLAAGLTATSALYVGTPGLVTHPESVLRLPLLSWWGNVPIIFSRDFLMFTGGHFRPLGYAVLASLRTFFPADATWFWRTLFFLVHFFNVILAFHIFEKFARRTSAALLAAFVFALHPIGSVVFGRAGNFHYLLGTTFLLGSLNLYLSGHFGTRYVLSPVLFLLSLLTCKAGGALPVFLLAYEALYRGRSIRRSVLHALPFLGPLLVLAPFWLYYKPHPLHYRYISFAEGSGWFSFFSVVGATGLYLKGLLAGIGVPAVLHETAERIFKFYHPKFIVWTFVNIIILGAGILAARRTWAGLGVLLAYCGTVPFLSTTWNGVEEYVYWPYLYLPSLGLAMVVGGVVDLLLSKGEAWALAAGYALVVYYGISQVRLNYISKDELSYWERAYRLHPCGTASFNLGKAHLRRREVKEALDFLFSPQISQARYSCRVMSRYYARKGDYTASAVHLRMGSGEDNGIQFQDYEMAEAELFWRVGALDHAEDALGRVLTANPYNVEAMALLAEIWLRKGYLRAARDMIHRALRVDPGCPDVLRTLGNVERAFSCPPETVLVISPPRPEWLRYALEDVREAPMREEIVKSSERLPYDPIVQMEAGICLSQEGRFGEALRKLSFTVSRIPSWSYAWAVYSLVACKSGAYSEALKAARRALELDPQSSSAHSVLGFLYDRMAEKDRRMLARAVLHYRRAVQFNPRNAGLHNNLGNALVHQGKLQEAEAEFRQAIRIRPDYAEPHYNLGNLLLQQGRVDEAIAEFREAVRFRPDFVEARNNLGTALLQKGRIREAIVQFKEAIRTRPDQGKAWDNLAVVLAGQGRYRKVEELLRGRLRVSPDDLRTKLNLAWLLSTCPDPEVRDGREAVKLAEEVLKASGGRSAEAMGVLAAAYAEAGRFRDAVRTARRAISVARSSGREELARSIEAQLRDYEARRPFRMGG